jgi:excisionase family DNA binding protein
MSKRRKGSPQTNLYTVAETAAVLGVSQQRIFQWIDRETLPVIRLGPENQAIRVRQADLEAFVQNEFKSHAPTGQSRFLHPNQDNDQEENK